MIIGGDGVFKGGSAGLRIGKGVSGCVHGRVWRWFIGYDKGREQSASLGRCCYFSPMWWACLDRTASPWTIVDTLYT